MKHLYTVINICNTERRQLDIVHQVYTAAGKYKTPSVKHSCKVRRKNSKCDPINLDPDKSPISEKTGIEECIK